MAVVRQNMPQPRRVQVAAIRIRHHRLLVGDSQPAEHVGSFVWGREERRDRRIGGREVLEPVHVDRAGDMTVEVPRARTLGLAREPAIAHQQVLIAQTRGQFSAAHQRHAGSHFVTAARWRSGTVAASAARSSGFRPDQQRRRVSPAWLVTQAERKPPSAGRAVGRRLLVSTHSGHVFVADPVAAFVRYRQRAQRHRCCSPACRVRSPG